ncbi:MAG: ABC transporter substrate-binding protein [Burkholderiales bacterium]|nr:ABC transporter substrate-binding protein [Burkholderiales bacterium]
MRPTRTALCAAAALLASLTSFSAHAQASGPIKIGLMLPYSGTYAALGNAIENGFKLYVQEQGGKLGGREIQYFKVDDESEPSKGTDNVNKLIKRDNVDVLVGTVHSGVALAMAKAAKDNNTLLVIPNAGADAITGAMCSANIVRSSFSNWQPGYAMGVVAAQKGVKRAMTITWNYAAGAESTKGFTEGLEKGGGKVIKDLNLPFPGVEFQALLTEIAAQKPDAVYAFFAGGGAVKFVKDYAAAGLNKTIPLYGPGFLTDGTLEAQGASAQNMLTTLHYADDLNTPKNNAFRKAYALAYKAQPDVYAVQGYDAAQILGAGLKAAGGDLGKRDVLTAAMHKTVVDSPRGKFTISPAGNPVQDIYLREVKGNNNEFRSIAVKSLSDPARGCKL